MGTPSLTLNDVIPPPWPPLLLPHDQYSRVANETLWCDRQYSRSCACFSFSKNLISVFINFQSKDQIPTTFYISFPKNDQFFIQNWSISDYATRSCVFVALSWDCSLAGLYCPQYDRKRNLLLADNLRKRAFLVDLKNWHCKKYSIAVVAFQDCQGLELIVPSKWEWQWQ